MAQFYVAMWRSWAKKLGTFAAVVLCVLVMLLCYGGNFFRGGGLSSPWRRNWRNRKAWSGQQTRLP
jgi:hypothetical protein